MREDEVPLQELQLVVGNVRLRQLAETGVDAIDGLAFGHDRAHRGGAGIEAPAARGVEGERVVGAREGFELVEREAAGLEEHYLRRASMMRATWDESTSFWFSTRANLTDTIVLPLRNTSSLLTGIQKPFSPTPVSHFTLLR